MAFCFCAAQSSEFKTAQVSRTRDVETSPTVPPGLWSKAKDETPAVISLTGCGQQHILSYPQNL